MSATEPTGFAIRCDYCGKIPELEYREFIGCVASCDCQTAPVQGKIDVPEGWE